MRNLTWCVFSVPASQLGIVNAFVGLIRLIDDSELVAYMHYVLEPRLIVTYTFSLIIITTQ